MISDILSVTKAVGDLVTATGDAGKTASKVAGAAMSGYADAKSAIMSIAEKSKKSIMMYKVLISSGIREADLAVKITKYLERMYAVFTLLVLGYNPMANSNSEINSIIKSISAENSPVMGDTERHTLINAMVDISNEHDYGHRKPKIGKNYVSSESSGVTTTPVSAKAILEHQQKEKAEAEKARSAFPRPHYAKVNDVAFSQNVASKSDKNLPTIINMHVNTGGKGTISIPIAVKCNMYPITSDDMRLLVESGITNSVTHTNVLRSIKHKSGEISTLAWLFKTDEAERNAKLYKNLGKNPWFIELQKRKAAAKNSFWGSFLSRFGSEYETEDGKNGSVRAASREINAAINAMPPTASLILTKEDLVSATRLSAEHFTKNEGFIARFMKEAFLLCFGIVDLTEEKCDFFFMGYTNPFTVTFKELDNAESDNNKALYEAVRELSRKV